MTAIPDVNCEEVVFKDMDGDEFKFTLTDSGKMCYWLNGQRRPEFSELSWQPAMGVPGIALPDINKGFPIPRKQTPEILGKLRFLSKQAKASMNVNIPEVIVIPEGDRPGIDNAIAEKMLSARANQ
eukprot:TRINITY_DN2096_c6_g1_i1.p1 TRINITY_DN2096_c6_g1~~TRINITY_DN2096_c6_g1_i1.p1  ORF type:complete len:134 (+),score=20.62 TRINITY_DN2096_c6_g1_i1:26-403(+)